MQGMCENLVNTIYASFLIVGIANLLEFPDLSEFALAQNFLFSKVRTLSNFLVSRSSSSLRVPSLSEFERR